MSTLPQGKDIVVPEPRYAAYKFAEVKVGAKAFRLIEIMYESPKYIIGRPVTKDGKLLGGILNGKNTIEPVICKPSDIIRRMRMNHAGV